VSTRWDSDVEFHDQLNNQFLYLYLYLYDNGLQQAEPLMSISSVLPMCVQTIRESINRRCINDILWKLVPVNDHSLTESSEMGSI